MTLCPSQGGNAKQGFSLHLHSVDKASGPGTSLLYAFYKNVKDASQSLYKLSDQWFSNLNVHETLKVLIKNSDYVVGWSIIP